MSEHVGNRRIDKIRDPGFVADLAGLPLDDLRARRDDCLAEREYLSLLRRLLQGRAEILKAEAQGRATGETAPLVDRLSEILSDDDHPVTSRGEAVRVGVPEEEMLLARRRVERLASDAEISDPVTLDDAALTAAIAALVDEEEGVSGARRDVFEALDALQDELKRRYKDDPSLSLR
ncbi:MAG: aerial mycelium formation protein [Actinomycetota bacterium]